MYAKSALSYINVVPERQHITIHKLAGGQDAKSMLVINGWPSKQMVPNDLVSDVLNEIFIYF